MVSLAVAAATTAVAVVAKKEKRKLRVGLLENPSSRYHVKIVLGIGLIPFCRIYTEGNVVIMKKIWTKPKYK